MTVDNDQRLTAGDIPLSVVYFEFNQVTAGMIAELLATRGKRDLQRVNFFRISDSKVAASLAELVCTDPDKQWTLEAVFDGTAAVAFADAATASGQPTLALPSSLTDLYASMDSHPQVFASLLSATPRMTRFVVHNDQIQCSGYDTSLAASLTACSCFFVVHGCSPAQPRDLHQAVWRCVGTKQAPAYVCSRWL